MKPSYLHTYYSQDWVYKEIQNYFSLEELFSKKMCNRYSTQQLWSFLDFRLLSNMLYIRKTRDISISVNTWNSGGSMSQRGFRSILSRIVMGYAAKGKLYASAHVLGSGIDFNEKGIEAKDTRVWIEQNASDLPFKCRLEWKKGGKEISWVHLDVAYFKGNPKVYKFNV